MDLEALRSYCLAKKGVTEEFPFDEETLVFKVMGKMFVLTNIESFESMNLKASPEEVAQRCEAFEGVTPGYHMNKKHWITVWMDRGIPDRTLRDWVDESYRLVAGGLSRSDRLTLKSL